MKQFVWKWSLGLTLTALPLVGGCLQENAGPPVGLAQPGAAAATVFTTNPPAAPVTAIADSNANAVPSTNELANAEIKPVKVDAAPPANVRTNGAMGQIVRLANSGVDETVLLAYVNNAGSVFDLSPEEIIYLKDLGVPPAVVTAMIQRDQALLKGSAATETNLPEYAQAPVAAVANPPTPAEVAPQPVPGSAPVPLQVVQAGPPAENPTYNTFYSSLAPYGTWVDVAGYGWCWRPTVVAQDPGWQPYYDNGRWVYTDYGWYWYSDYSWGWAPFHYGRWFHHNVVGWCWAPDSVWGPSWVSWRYSPEYCGWAPLPPAACYSPGLGFTWYGGSVAVSFGFGLAPSCYTFVGWGDFHHHYPGHHSPPSAHHNTEIYNKTVVVNRYEGNHNTVINRGIAPERVSELTKTEVRKVSVRDAGRESLRAGRGEKLDPASRTLAVYRPQIPQAPAASAGGLRHERNVSTSAGSATENVAARNINGASTTTVATPSQDPLRRDLAARATEKAPVTIAPSAAVRSRRGESVQASATTPAAMAPKIDSSIGARGTLTTRARREHPAEVTSGGSAPTITRSETAVAVAPQPVAREGRSSSEGPAGSSTIISRQPRNVPEVGRGTGSSAASVSRPESRSLEARNVQRRAMTPEVPASSAPPSPAYTLPARPPTTYSAPRGSGTQERSQARYLAEAPTYAAPAYTAPAQPRYITPSAAPSPRPYSAPSYSAPSRNPGMDSPRFEMPPASSGGGRDRGGSGLSSTPAPASPAQPSYPAPTRESRSGGDGGSSGSRDSRRMR